MCELARLHRLALADFVDTDKGPRRRGVGVEDHDLTDDDRHVPRVANDGADAGDDSGADHRPPLAGMMGVLRMSIMWTPCGMARGLRRVRV